MCSRTVRLRNSDSVSNAPSDRTTSGNSSTAGKELRADTNYPPELTDIRLFGAHANVGSTTPSGEERQASHGAPRRQRDGVLIFGNPAPPSTGVHNETEKSKPGSRIVFIYLKLSIVVMIGGSPRTVKQDTAVAALAPQLKSGALGGAKAGAGDPRRDRFASTRR
jgi:hypothetical protein